MDKALNEIGKLRNEMKVGCIEVKNQMENMTTKIVGSLSKFSNTVEKGFIAIEEAIDEDMHDFQKEIENIKTRLDKANL